MKLMEIAALGHDVKVSEHSPTQPGQVGKIKQVATGQHLVEFPDGSTHWIPNKHIVGTRLSNNREQVSEMAAKKICDKCGNSMSGHHFWRKGGWHCIKNRRSGEAVAAGKSEQNSDSFPYMHDDDYSKLSAADKAAQDAKEQSHHERNHRTGPKDYQSKDANDAAAQKRAEKFRQDQERKRK